MNYFLTIDGAIYMAEQHGTESWWLFDDENRARGKLYIETAAYDTTSNYVIAENRFGDMVACVAYLNLRGGIETAARELLAEQ